MEYKKDYKKPYKKKTSASKVGYKSKRGNTDGSRFMATDGSRFTVNG